MDRKRHPAVTTRKIDYLINHPSAGGLAGRGILQFEANKEALIALRISSHEKMGLEHGGEDSIPNLSQIYYDQTCMPAFVRPTGAERGHVPLET